MSASQPLNEVAKAYFEQGIAGTLPSPGAGATIAAGDSIANPTTGQVITDQMLWNGATWERQRTPKVFKTVKANAAGNTAAWTPASGKKFRLLGYTIEVTSNTSVTGGAILDIVLNEGSTALGLGHSFYAPNTTVTTNLGRHLTPWIFLGNGILASAADAVLNVNLSATLGGSGICRVTVCGTEE